MKEKVIRILKLIGLGFFEPLIRIKENPSARFKEFFVAAIVPLLASIAFILFWHWSAMKIQDNTNEKIAKNGYYQPKYDEAINTGKSKEQAEQIAKASVAKFYETEVDKPQRMDKIKDEVDDIVEAKGGISKVTMADFSSIDEELMKGITMADIQTINSLEYDYVYQMKHLPRPKDVWVKAGLLWKEYKDERAKEKAFYDRMDAKIEKIKNSKMPEAAKEKQIEKLEAAKYPGFPTMVDQIITSLYTVGCAFLMAALIAVPLGILVGLYPAARSAINPIVQIFKPVSPVVWFLLVSMIVNALIDTETAMVPKSFTISYIAVALCAMWATLINTAQGVSTVDQDFLNVASVLKLEGIKKITKVVLPASVPMIFTGLRITLTTGWMVLIAVELLAQNPGLGKFVWDEYNNGSSNSNSKILVALFVIGIIGFLLDRLMLMIQKSVTFTKND